MMAKSYSAERVYRCYKPSNCNSKSRSTDQISNYISILWIARGKNPLMLQFLEFSQIMSMK